MPFTILNKTEIQKTYLVEWKVNINQLLVYKFGKYNLKVKYILQTKW